MENTLYQGQPLRNLLNMSAGDMHVVEKIPQDLWDQQNIIEIWDLIQLLIF